MNLFFKLALITIAFVLANRAHAIQVHALYTASCQREVGVILNVDSHDASVLNLQGQIVKVPRFEVIYLATYSLDTVPIEAVENPSVVPFVEIQTYESGGLVTLVKGWPVDFSQDKIAFLSLYGSEIMIDRSSIWGVDSDLTSTVARFTHTSHTHYDFVHPYAFSSCPTSNGTRVFPQQLLNDPIAIKKEFDRYAAGYKQVKRYESDQQFYPVPEIYSNETSLGLWLMGGTRYGASANRKNNFAPYLVDEFSAGPFGFQSIFTTGSGPLLQSIHEETQTQAYFRMKADYFHFSAMVDPSLILVGSKYNWVAEDMAANDFRANESAFVEFGFDYGRFALELYPGGATNIGARNGDLFKQTNVSLTRAGIRYQGFRWLFNLIGGGGSRDGFNVFVLRANFDWQPNKNHRVILSLIDRKLSFDGTSSTAGTPPFQVEAQSYTAAAYGYMRFRTRYWAGLMLAAESVNEKHGLTDLNAGGWNKVFPKAGALISLSF